MTNRDKNIVGEVLAKTYRIERFLGAGTVGTVYVARHVRSVACTQSKCCIAGW